MMFTTHYKSKDENVLRAMGVALRENFVEGNFVRRAYEDIALPIGNEQTISQPYTVAYMTQALNLKKGERVLEIGTGSQCTAFQHRHSKPAAAWRTIGIGHEHHNIRSADTSA